LLFSQFGPRPLQCFLKAQFSDGLLGIKENYEGLVTAVKQGLAESAYQWPNPTGYSFSLPEVTESGGPANRAYIALYAPESRKGKVQVYFQPRAIAAAGGESSVKQFASALSSSYTPKGGGCGEIWIDGHKPATDYFTSLRSLCEAVTNGWKAKKENAANAEQTEAAVMAQS
jgi:hypothetical protein